MKQFLITAAGVFAGLLIFLIGVPFVLIAVAVGAASGPPTPAHSVLELDLREPLSDQSPRNPLANLGGGSLSVMSIVETLRAGAPAAGSGAQAAPGGRCGTGAEQLCGVI